MLRLAPMEAFVSIYQKFVASMFTRQNIQIMKQPVRYSRFCRICRQEKYGKPVTHCWNRLPHGERLGLHAMATTALRQFKYPTQNPGVPRMQTAPEQLASG